MRLSVKTRSTGDNPRRSKKVTVLAAVAFAIVLITVTGCFGGSDDGSSEVTITRSSRTRDISTSRTTSSSRAITSTSDHGESASSGDEVVSSTGHGESASSGDVVASSTDHETTSDSGDEAVSDSGHDSGEAVAVSHTTSSSDDSHGDAVSSPESSSDAEPDHGTSEEAGEEAGHGPTWEYTGAVGQNYWGLLEESFNSCVDGSAQSPIDVRDTLVTDLQDISFHYNPALLVISNNGHTI